jgi:PKD repeat protein
MKNRILSLLLSISFFSLYAQTVTTYSGDKANIGNSNNVPVASAKWSQPLGICSDPRTGNIYISDVDAQCVKIIAGGTVYIRAGSAFFPGTQGSWGYTNQSGISAQFHDPKGIVCDANGNVYVCDYSNNAIRKIAPYVNPGNTQAVTTFAGPDAQQNPPAGLVDNTNPLNARFDGPYGICTDGTYLYVTEDNNNTIRKITIATGAVTTLTGAASGATGGYQDGTLAQAKFKYPRGIAYNSTDNTLIVCDYGNNRIRRILLGSSTVETYAGGGGTLAGDDGPRLAGNGCSVKSPEGVLIDPFGHIFFTASSNAHTLRRIDKATNYVTTLCGSHQLSGNTDGVGKDARFYQPAGILMTPDKKTLYICDNQNGLIRAVDLTPVADFYAPTTSINTNSVVMMRDTSLSMITSWSWTVTPGSVNVNWQFVNGTTSTSQHPQIKFMTPGFFNIKLDVVNPYGTASKTKSNYIQVNSSNGQPVADFTADKTQGDVNSIFQFTNLTTNSASCKYNWSFNPATISYLNGTGQNSKNPQVRFTTTGKYTVTLNVTDTTGTFTVTPAMKTNYISINNIGIKQNAMADIFSIYPNPAHGALSIGLKETKGAANVTILDINGKAVHSFSMEEGTRQELNLSDLSAGIYLVKVECGGLVSTQRLIIN